MIKLSDEEIKKMLVRIRNQQDKLIALKDVDPRELEKRVTI